MIMPDATWRKCNVAAAATMGGASTAAFIRAAVDAALATLARNDVALRGAFHLIDEAERLAGRDPAVVRGRPRKTPVAQVSQVSA